MSNQNCPSCQSPSSCMAMAVPCLPFSAFKGRTHPRIEALRPAHGEKCGPHFRLGVPHRRACQYFPVNNDPSPLF